MQTCRRSLFRHRVPATLAALAALTPLAGAQTLALVAETAAGVDANSESTCSRQSVSLDGRYVAFTSWANNLHAPPPPNLMNVYLKDRATGAVTLLSKGPLGAFGDGHSWQATISADGNTVVFTTDATNLTGAALSGWAKVCAWDRATDSVSLVSFNYAGAAAGGTEPVVSCDGRYVAFQGAGLTCFNSTFLGIYRRDRVLGVTELVSGTPGCGHLPSENYQPSISGDGRFVAFRNYSALGQQIYVRDMLDPNGPTLASRTSGGVPGNGGSEDPFLSLDGRWLAMKSTATNLVTSHPLGGGTEILMLERATHQWSLASFNFSAGTPAGGNCQMPSLSPSGRFVAFVSSAPQLDPSLPSSGYQQVYVRDMHSTTVKLASHYMGAVGNGPSLSPSLCGAENLVVFQSQATNLLPPNATPAYFDVYAQIDPLGSPAPYHWSTYCTAGVTSQHCIAAMSASGTPSVSASSGFVVSATGVDAQRQGVVFYGVGGPHASPWGSGSSFLCVKSPQQRTGAQSSGGAVGCEGALTLDWCAYIAAHPAALGTPYSAGDDVWIQAWFRDPPSAKSTSLSNGLRFTTTP